MTDTEYAQATTVLEPLMSVDQVAAVLGVSRATVYRLVQDGQIRVTQVRSRKRFSPSDISSYVSQATGPSA
jgi:excisionase family DNA binding protein